jgi:hypothetical protein
MRLNDSRLVTAFFTLLKAGPAAAPGRPRAGQRRDGPPGHRPHRPPQPAPTPHLIDTLSSTGRGLDSPVSGMPKRKAPTAGSSDGTLWGLGCVSQRTSTSTRTALAAAALAEPLGEALPDGRAGLLGDLQQKARSGSQRISNRHPASSHHKDRVHTLAPRPTRGIGFKGGTGATKSAPHARGAPRRWSCLGTLRPRFPPGRGHPDTGRGPEEGVRGGTPIQVQPGVQA